MTHVGAVVRRSVGGGECVEVVTAGALNALLRLGLHWVIVVFGVGGWFRAVDKWATRSMASRALPSLLRSASH